MKGTARIGQTSIGARQDDSWTPSNFRKLEQEGLPRAFRREVLAQKGGPDLSLRAGLVLIPTKEDYPA